MACVDLALRKINEDERRKVEREEIEAAVDIDRVEPRFIFQKGAVYTPEQMKQLAVLARAKRGNAA